jgi:hypothetical protein
MVPSEHKSIKAETGSDVTWVSRCQVENMISTTVPQTNKALKPSEHKALKPEPSGDMTWVSYCSAK